MKVSKEKREEIRRSLVAAAVALFTDQGIAETSMRDIAARAGVAPGTAYKYFPNREQLFYAYFELKQDDAQAALEQITDFDRFSFKEKLQAYVEAMLAQYVAEREFVAIALRNLIDSPLQSLGALAPAKRKLAAQVERFFEQAVAHGEIAEAEHRGFLINLFWDYVNLVVLYWLRDDSEEFVRTSEFIDVSLDVYVGMVESGLVDKTARVLSFLLKTHLYGSFDRLASLVATLGRPPRAGDGVV